MRIVMFRVFIISLHTAFVSHLVLLGLLVTRVTFVVVHAELGVPILASDLSALSGIDVIPSVFMAHPGRFVSPLPFLFIFRHSYSGRMSSVGLINLIPTDVQSHQEKLHLHLLTVDRGC